MLVQETLQLNRPLWSSVGMYLVGFCGMQPGALHCGSQYFSGTERWSLFRLCGVYTQNTFFNARFPEYFPAYLLLAGNIPALYFPYYHIPPRGTYCEPSLLDSPMVRGFSLLNPILLTHIQ